MSDASWAAALPVSFLFLRSYYSPVLFCFSVFFSRPANARVVCFVLILWTELIPLHGQKNSIFIMFRVTNAEIIDKIFNHPDEQYYNGCETFVTLSLYYDYISMFRHVYLTYIYLEIIRTICNICRLDLDCISL